MKIFAIVAMSFLVSEAALAESHAAPANDVVAAALAGGDVDAGEQVFRKCRACHQVGEDAQAKVGPPLNDIVGAALGVFPDFRYSPGLIAMGEEGTVWTVENLDAYFLKPRDFVAGSRMTFAGLRKDEDRANVIAYLASLTETE